MFFACEPKKSMHSCNRSSIRYRQLENSSYFGQQSAHDIAPIGPYDIPYFYVKKSVACMCRLYGHNVSISCRNHRRRNCTLVKITLCVASKRCTSSFSSVKINEHFRVFANGVCLILKVATWEFKI